MIVFSLLLSPSATLHKTTIALSPAIASSYQPIDIPRRYLRPHEVAYLLRPVQWQGVTYTLIYLAEDLKSTKPFTDGELFMTFFGNALLDSFDDIGVTGLLVFEGSPAADNVVTDEALLARLFMASAMEVYLTKRTLDELKPLPPTAVAQVEDHFRDGLYGVVSKVAFAEQEIADLFRTDESRYLALVRNMLAAEEPTVEEQAALDDLIVQFLEGRLTEAEFANQVLGVWRVLGKVMKYSNSRRQRAQADQLQGAFKQIERVSAKIPGHYEIKFNKEIVVRGQAAVDLLEILLSLQRILSANEEKVALLDAIWEASQELGARSPLAPELETAINIARKEARSLPTAAIDVIVEFTYETAVNKSLEIAKDQLTKAWAKWAWHHFGTRTIGHFVAGAASSVLLGYTIRNIAFGQDGVYANAYLAKYAESATRQFGELAHEIRATYPPMSSLAVDGRVVTAYQGAFAFKQLAEIQFWNAFADAIDSTRLYQFVVDLFTGGRSNEKEQDARDWAKSTGRLLYPYWIHPPIIGEAVALAIARSAAREESDDNTAAVDIVLLIDSSASMSNNDPDRLRLDAAAVFIDKLQPDDNIAVVDFDDNIHVVWS
ncbi:MAG: VWA domain-containing protein, partial [Caldilineaceae bacterium]|nr:VWA domain-containing protein [Caldilineaceae bacterium]